MEKKEVLYFHTKPLYIEVLTATTKQYSIYTVDVEFEKREDGKQGKPVASKIQVNKPLVIDNTVTYKKSAKLRTVRATFAGVIIHQTEDNVELHIGVAKQGVNDTFSKKKGRSISYKRALGCPILIVYCTKQEVIPIFHKKCKELENSVIFEDHVKCTIETPKVNATLQDILEETSAD